MVEKLWKPLLDSKFDGKFDDLPATYIWARTRRMGSTRDKSGREVMGWLDGGYQTIIDALEQKIVALGGEVHAGATVEQIAAEGGRAVGVVVDGRLQRFDHVLCTLAPPMARRVLAPELAEQAPADHCRYLGVVCLLLRVKRSVSPYYHLNITDRRVPLTTVVETTHVVDPERVGGHLLYVSKYVDPGHPDHEASPEELERKYMDVRAHDLPRPARRRDRLVGRAAGARDRAGAPRRRRQAPARDVLGAGALARFDRARLPGDRQRAGRDRRHEPGRARDPRAASGRPAGGGMTTVAVAFQERIERVRTAAFSDARAIPALALLTAILAAFTWGTWGDLDSDTGYDIAASARIVDGELPYRDFVYYYGPLAPALGGLVSFVANVGIWSAVGLGFAITLAILAATYGVARIVVDPLGAALATAIAAAVAFIPDNFSYVLPHTNDATLGTLLLLVLLIGIWRYACNATSARLVVVGSCVGLLL